MKKPKNQKRCGLTEEDVLALMRLGELTLRIFKVLPFSEKMKVLMGNEVIMKIVEASPLGVLHTDASWYKLTLSEELKPKRESAQGIAKCLVKFVEVFKDADVKTLTESIMNTNCIIMTRDKALIKRIYTMLVSYGHKLRISRV